MDKKIVIVGAGYSGILTAKKLAKKCKKEEGVSITIIDRNPFHTMLTELHEVAACRVEEESIKISLKKIFAGRNVKVVMDEVASIDFENRAVIGANQQYAYDYLVLAAGSKPTYFGVTGAEEYAFKLWSYDDAVILREHIHASFDRASRMTDEAEIKKTLTFFVVGAGFTGVEMVGELAEYVPILCNKFEIPREMVTICDVDVLPRTVPVLPEKLSDKVEKRLHKMGVTVMLGTNVVAIGPDYIETKKGDELTKTAAGTVIWAAGIEGSVITTKAAETLESAGRGRIQVDAYLRAVGKENIFVTGDNIMYIPEGETAPVPQTVENGEHSADTAANNLYCALTGKGHMEEYKPAFHGLMVCVGGRYGVARVGTPKHMFNLPSFLAMFVKHFINIIYFFSVAGYNKVISYMKHEFFTIRNCRSFVGGHFSNRTPSFLLVPLRVFLGAVWLFEGIMKIVEGWLSTPMLTGFFGGAKGWYDTILNSGAATGVADAVSSATGAADAAAGAADAVSSATGAAGGAGAEATASVGTTILNFDFLGLFSVIFVSGKDLAHSVLSDYAFKIDVPLMNWFMDKFLLPSDSMQVFMQVCIVLAEICIGLALMGGLFTFPAAAVSLVLQLMFVCTTGLYLGTFWMIFAGIAVLIGAGRTIGLDYYAMPALKKGWKHIPIVRKSYLYHD